MPAAEHLNAIEHACSRGCYSFDRQQDVLAHVSLGQLQSALASARVTGKPISVIHLLCHGGAIGTTFGLTMNGEAAAADAVTVDAGRLRQLLAPHASMVRLVVLMACDSGNSGALGNQLGSLAQNLHRAGIASVVASRYPLSVTGSIRMAETLYSRLLVDLSSLEGALLSTREALALDASQFDWASMQLYARAADGGDTRPIVFRPYQGLSAFGIETRRFFFGRETLIEKLLQRLRTLYDASRGTRLLAVLGPSGSGKSSVACAGLFSELESRPIPGPKPMWVAMFKPGDHPRQALDLALLSLERGPAETSGCLLIDRLEEIYTCAAIQLSEILLSRSCCKRRAIPAGGSASS